VSGYEASLYVEEKEKVIAKGGGSKHFETLGDLQKEVGVRENK
jgi:hypothetical protein